jgi:hypothetical protein
LSRVFLGWKKNARQKVRNSISGVHNPEWKGNSMGFRFHKTTKLFPGIRLNLSLMPGIGTSFGVSGATINIGKRATRGTVGTGVSYFGNLSSPTHTHSATTPESKESMNIDALLMWGIFGLFVFLVAYGLVT